MRDIHPLKIVLGAKLTKLLGLDFVQSVTALHQAIFTANIRLNLLKAHNDAMSVSFSILPVSFVA
jgi:hypothetical protein